eukprot:8289290-Pyramimonas_sp.AAC.1
MPSNLTRQDAVALRSRVNVPSAYLPKSRLRFQRQDLAPAAPAAGGDHAPIATPRKVRGDLLE